MDYPLNTEQYSIIYKVSFLSLGSSIYAKRIFTKRI